MSKQSLTGEQRTEIIEGMSTLIKPNFPKNPKLTFEDLMRRFNNFPDEVLREYAEKHLKITHSI